jgi:hypothetical protein
VFKELKGSPERRGQRVLKVPLVLKARLVLREQLDPREQQELKELPEELEHKVLLVLLLVVRQTKLFIRMGLT